MDDVDAKVVPVVLGESGTVFNKNEGTYKEKRIVYQFVMQAFLKAYLGAWKKYAEADGNEVDPQFLIIEEINRGNCAQIFGDLFQLLDRGDNGFSEYPIEADNDLQREIERAFIEHKDYKLKEGVKINVEGAVKDYTSNYGATLSEDIQSGRVLLLPSNLYIWATMNTSDQSLFPIDSAFKRRWDWKYMPIENAEKGWKIKVNGNEYDWYKFLDAINKEVFGLTHSEDKQLGYFFAKAKDGIVDAETLVNKVYFYLWTDVFKDYDYESQKAFRKSNSNEPIAFKDFFKKGQELDEIMAQQVLINLELEKLNNPQDLFE
jgi:5-methylcytosine-specific restriction endonuclease McrBC GTP-binding regulatory subunit McrB